jgi:DNA-binding NtrC family response regulator
MPIEVQRAVARLLAQPGRGRIIASTAEPLLSRVLHGEFDDCLYYRLNVVHVVIPNGHSPRLRAD